ncbi:hypothetical protein Syun_025961 [Stephania yunnanensis]|uniref:Uncharacterized protein n=1 Tax=Stephania yunnanensis TaxID=152371 RepID=A0AAP0ESN4_9MAGN
MPIEKQGRNQGVKIELTVQRSTQAMSPSAPYSDLDVSTDLTNKTFYKDPTL